MTTTETRMELDRTLDSLQTQAQARDMVVCPQLPGFPLEEYGTKFPILVWEGTDSEYVALAQDAGARIFYASGHVFDFETVLTKRVAEYRVSQFLYDEEDYDVPSSDATLAEGSTSWMLNRLRQCTHDWEGRNGSLFLVQCVWLAEGIAHNLERQAQWFVAFEDKLQGSIESATALLSENARTASRMTTDRVANRAHELARHPRFRDATSEAKRIYMAREIFGDDEEVKAIAERAALDFWWAVEPEQKLNTAATVRKLNGEGVPVVTIAATVGLSKEKINAILLDDKEPSQCA